jgi:hypothetical protein
MTEVTNPADIMAQIGGNASGIMIWDGFDSAYIHPTLHGASMTPPNDAGNGPAPLAYDIPTGTYSPRPSFYEDEQIFKFAPPGSVRVGAAESNGNLTLYAFYHRASGRLTLVGRNAGGTNLTVSASLSNLPAATSFELYRTNAGSNFARLPDVPVANGSMAFLVPANSFVTLTTVTIPDTTPPTVSVTAPANGSTVTGTVAVSAAANDNVGVAGVQFLLDGNALGAEDTTAPYSVSWGTAAISNGPHTLTARARDAAGNNTTSAVVPVTVSNVPDMLPPAVLITAPVNNATVSGAVAVTADASDNVGVAGVQFLLDGANLGAEDAVAPYSVSWGTVGVSNGLHTLSARARDVAGNNTTSAAVTVTVNNTANAGLVAAYGFEEGTGSTVGDSTTNGLNGTISAATWVTAGKYGKALSFNGTSALVTVADAAALRLTIGMTLEAWVRPAAASTNWSTALLKERPGGLSYALYAFDGANKPPAGYVNVGGSDRNATGTSVLSLSAWTHLAATYDGSAVRLYVNGAQAASRAQTGTITSSTSALRIGGNAVWGEYFNGLIDEVRIYNRALTAAEITQDMNTPVGGGSGGLRLARAPNRSRTVPETLREAQLAPMLTAAEARWAAVGAGPGALAAVPIHLADLPGAELGFTSAGSIWIDRDAAGYGWFIDPTPGEDGEFPAGPGSRAYGKVDLLTVLTHELGHVLGLEHDDDAPGNHLMDSALPLGTRRLPEPVEAFSPDDVDWTTEAVLPAVRQGTGSPDPGAPAVPLWAQPGWAAGNPWDDVLRPDHRLKTRGYLADRGRPGVPSAPWAGEFGPPPPPRRPQD